MIIWRNDVKKKALIIYYLVLFGGFFLFYGLVLIGSRYEDVVQNFVDRYPYIFFAALFGYIYVYLRSLKAIISTKGFNKIKKYSKKRLKENRERNLKKFKMAIPILAIYSIFHLICTVFLTIKISNGGEVNFILQYWSKLFVIPFVFLFTTIHCYKHTKKIIKEEQEDKKPFG